MRVEWGSSTTCTAHCAAAGADPAPPPGGELDATAAPMPVFVAHIATHGALCTRTTQGLVALSTGLILHLHLGGHDHLGGSREWVREVGKDAAQRRTP